MMPALAATGAAPDSGAGVETGAGAGAAATGSSLVSAAAGAGVEPDSYAASFAFSSSDSAIVARQATTTSSRKSSTSSGSKPSLKRTCWNCFVTTSSGVNAMVVPLSSVWSLADLGGRAADYRRSYQASIAAAVERVEGGGECVGKGSAGEGSRDGE